jgi:hypothetical protein
VNKVQIFFHPSNKVVFEGAFDDLMKKIGGYELMNISSRKSISKWLTMLHLVYSKAVL